MNLAEKLRRIPPLGWAAIFAVLLIFPLLGSFGFWDPWELNIAERARDIASAGSLTDVTAGKKYTAIEPPLDLFLSALGMKVFGPSELGARVGNALAALLALLGVYWAGVGLFRPRAALLATLVLGTMPLFFLQARQITSDMPLVAGLAFALGGLGRFAWPAEGRRRPQDLAIAAAGMLVGTLSGGALLGIALPCLALAGAVAIAWGMAPAAEGSEAARLAGRGAGAEIPEDAKDGTFGKTLLSGKGLAVLAVAAVGILVLVLTLTNARVAGQFSLLLGGTPRGGTPPQKFEFLIRQVGFGAFPWSALIVFALGRALIRLGDDASERGGRLAFGQVYLLLFAGFGYALSTVFVLMTGEARFAPLCALALAAGVFLDEALDGERAEPVLGLLVATGTMVVARDFYLSPEELPSLHVLAKVKWPPQITVGAGFLAIGFVVALGIYLGLATRGRALGKVPLRDVSNAGKLRRDLERWVVQVGRYGIHGALAAAVLFAFLVNDGLVPALSKHYSFKPVLQSFTRFAREDEPIGKYRVEGHGTGFYSKRDLVDLQTEAKVVEFLRQPSRAFALVSADELGSLDAALKQADINYFVVDASSSRFLLLSNRLGGAGEEDRNPLKKNVWKAPQQPTLIEGAAALGPHYDWRGQQPPWAAPRVPVYAEFANAIELVGADYPPVVRRPAKIPLVLHFRVNTRPPAGYKIFVHFDAPGEPRVLGDHAPLDGAFPTTHWLAGEYVKDPVDVDVPLMTTPAGTYTLYVGFWPGGEQKRLRITGGSVNDGVDRAKIGTIEIR